MYRFVTKQEQKELAEACTKIILEVQKRMKDFFTFQYHLIGSGERKLITQNEVDGSFDLDFDFVLQRDKKDLSSQPEMIKRLFIDAFNQINPAFGFKFANDSTSVITSRLVLDQRLFFSFDVAILIEGNNGNFFKLIYEKNSKKYLWNELPHSRDFSATFKKIKVAKRFPQFKNRYLDLKNMHLSRRDPINSFSIFLETINEFRSFVE